MTENKIPAKYPCKPILLVDDNKPFLNIMKATLRTEADITNVVCCSDSREVEPMLAENDFLLVVLDIAMDYIRGDELLPKIVKKKPGLPVVMLTGMKEWQKSPKVKHLINNGAIEHIAKGRDGAEKKIVEKLKRMIEVILKSQKNGRTLGKHEDRKKTINKKHFEHIITKNGKMENIFAYIESIANSDKHVLITGETGVGKDLIARAIHNVSTNCGEFVRLNIAATNDNLFESTICGHKKGAFTDASNDKIGLIEEAKNGTLLLDEIGDLSTKSQIKLLDILQRKKFRVMGGVKEKDVLARIVLATNRDLKQMMDTGQFRKDFFERLNSHPIHVPPLRERREDIPELVEYFVEKFAAKQGKEISYIPAALYTMLSDYDFPRNIRELENLINDSISRSENEMLDLERIREVIRDDPGNGGGGDGNGYPDEPEGGIIFKGKIPPHWKMELQYLEKALEEAHDNQTEAATLTGLKRTTFINKLNRVRAIQARVNARHNGNRPES